MREIMISGKFDEKMIDNQSEKQFTQDLANPKHTVDEVEFENRVEDHYSVRGRDEENVEKESWNLSFKVPDDETDQFTENAFYHEAFYHDGSKKVERDLIDYNSQKIF